MFEVVRTTSDLANALWQWGVGAFFALVVGLWFVIWPRKSGAVFHGLIQAMRPYEVRKPSVRQTVVVGCLLLVTGVALSFATWEAALH